MTTAHRPTWHAARGASSADGRGEGGYVTGGAISNQFSAKDLPSELTLKVRKPEQRAESLSRAEMKAALVAKERASKGKDASALSEGTEAVGVPLASRPVRYMLLYRPERLTLTFLQIGKISMQQSTRGS